MAEHESVSKPVQEEGVRGRKRPQELSAEKLKGRAQEPEPKDLDAAAMESHASLLGDSRLNLPANAGQRAQLVSDLQRSYGNAYVQRLLKSRAVQAKLTVNPPGDKYEQEADRVAEAVTSASTAEVQRQAEEEEEEMQMKRAGDQTGLEVQRQEEEEEMIQSKAVSRAPEVSEDLEARIKGEEGKGEPIPDTLRASLEPHFGRDFSEARVHTDAEADSMSQQLGARAFTHGNDIFFREGDYRPESDEGKRLLSHEMTHVVQQGGAPIAMQAAETEGKKSSAGKEGAGEDLLNARDKMLADMSKASMKELVYQVARCLDEGLDGAALDALDAVALKALGAMKKMANALDVKTSSLKLAVELIDQVKREELTGGEEKEEEGEKTAEEALGNMLGWATARMNGAIKQLKAFPSEPTAKQAIDGAALVMMLGGDASPAIGAVKTWGETEKNIA